MYLYGGKAGVVVYADDFLRNNNKLGRLLPKSLEITWTTCTYGILQAFLWRLDKSYQVIKYKCENKWFVQFKLHSKHNNLKCKDNQFDIMLTKSMIIHFNCVLFDIIYRHETNPYTWLQLLKSWLHPKQPL